MKGQKYITEIAKEFTQSGFCSLGPLDSVVIDKKRNNYFHLFFDKQTKSAILGNHMTL